MSQVTTLDPGKRWAIMGAIMLGLFLSAMDQTIVGTALPRIIADLSGLHLYSWVFTAYLLASTTAVPIVGKLGDIYGRKLFFLIGIGIFLAGSMLSGLSQTMLQLIIFRGVQGVGGGFIFANAFAIIGDLFTPTERGRYMGLMSGVFGLASVIGPLIGGFITDHLDWRWVFYVNMPLGLAALAVIATVLPPSEHHERQHPIDFLDLALLVLTIVPLLLAFSWAGTDYAWTSPQVAAPLATSAIALAAFIFAEMRAADPIVPMALFRNRIVAVSMAVTLVSGAAMFAGTVYIPLFMQGVLGFSATNAGLVLTPMTLALVAGSIIGGQVIHRTGTYKWLCVIGLAISTVGLFLLSQLGTGSSQFTGMRDMAIVGFGLGLSFPTLMLSAQNAVPQAMLGVTTSLSQFFRSVGGVVGVAIMGSLLTRRLDSELTARLPARVQEEAPPELLGSLHDPQILLSDDALRQLRDEGFGGAFGADGAQLFAQALTSMREGLAVSISDIFVLGTALMVAAVLISFFLRDAKLRDAHVEVAVLVEGDTQPLEAGTRERRGRGGASDDAAL